MYTSSAFSSGNRSMYCTITVGSTTIAKNYIKSFDLSESAVANDSIMMGTTNSSVITIDLVNLTPTIADKLEKGSKVVPRVFVTDGTNNSSVTLGSYYIDDVVFIDGYEGAFTNATITAYDGFYLTEKKYTTPSIESPSIRTLVNEICTYQCSSLTMDTDAWSDTIKVTSVPTDCTVRTILGYLAGLQGCIAYFTRDDKISAKWYTSCSKTIGRDEQYLSSFENNGITDSTIKYLESGVQGGILVAGESGVLGTSISFENPMMTQERLTAIYNEKVKSNGSYLIKYRPCSVKWRGDPTIELCEIVKVTDSDGSNLNLYVMEREMNFDGGLYETYKCCIPSETTIAFSTNSTMQKLERKLTNMEEAVKKATDVISQTEGSVFEFVSANDPTNPSKNSGWKLHSTINDNVILANSNGIGFSTNGGESFNAASIYMDSNGGHIVATDIVAGSVSTDKLAVGTNANSDNLTKYLNKINTTTQIPTFVALGDAVRVCCNVSPEFAESFKIDNGVMINVTFRVSAKNKTDPNPKRFRLYKTDADGNRVGTYLKDGTYNSSTTTPTSTLLYDCEIPIFYNNVQVLNNESDKLWDAGETRTFVYNEGCWNMSESVCTSKSESVNITDKTMEHFGVCSTITKTSIKTVTISNFPSNMNDIPVGHKIMVYFAYKSSTSANNKLQINSLESYPLKDTSGIATLNWANCTTKVLMWTGSSWQETIDYNTSMDIAKMCLDTNSSYIDGSKIYAGSITAASCDVSSIRAGVISAGKITTDEMNVGTGKRHEILVNPGFSNGINGWMAYNGSIYKESISDGDYALKFIGGNEDDHVTAVSQYVYLEKGKIYTLSARIKPIDGYFFDNDNYIGLTAAKTVIPSVKLSSTTINNSNWTTISSTFKHTKASGVYDVGVETKGIRVNSTYSLDYYVYWVSLTEDPGSNTSSLKSSYSGWSSLYISDYVHRADIIKSTGLKVDADGTLSTVSSINSESGRAGILSYSSTETSISKVLLRSDDEKITFSDILNRSPDLNISYNSSMLVPLTAPYFSHMKFESREGDWNSSGSVSNFEAEGTQYSLVTPLGLYCKSGSYESQVRAASVSSTAFTCSSQEKIKKNISETKTALGKLKSSKVYTYNLKSDDSNANTKVGFIVERETPEEIISDDGTGINLYSMASMNWKATQELLERLETLENKVNGTENTEETV